MAISFFTFQQIAWLVDQYKNETPECSFSEYTCAVSFFPHLIAGPIIQYHELVPQLQNKSSFSLNWDNIAAGLFLIGMGAFKKIVIADSFSDYVALCFDVLNSLGILQAWVATLAYTMQIYFDFSGYCDIAIGSALLLGITLPINFNAPYKALSIQDFWRRWHITLGYFLTNYLYFPLGGSKGTILRTCFNIFFVMFISGIWHGAGFTFLLWGTVHGLALVVHRLWRQMGRKLPVGLAKGITFLFVSLAWVLFRAKDIHSAQKIYLALFGFDKIEFPRVVESFLGSGADIVFLKTKELFHMPASDVRILFAMLTLSFVVVFFCQPLQYIWGRYIVSNQKLMYSVSMGVGVLLFITLLKMLLIPYSEFIYYNF